MKIGTFLKFFDGENGRHKGFCIKIILFKYYNNLVKKMWNDEQFINAVRDNVSIAGVARRFDLKISGSSYSIIHKEIRRLKLDTSHFTGKAWNSGTRFRTIHKKIPLSEILVKNSNRANYVKLKKRLISEHIKEYKCECCKLTEWLGKPIPLELHHINGIKNDLRIENIKLLCPNCHSFTDNYRGKSKFKGINIRPKLQGNEARVP